MPLLLSVFCFSAQVHAFASKNTVSQIEGVNDAGQRWAYEFHSIPETVKCSLLDATTGRVIFQNSSWIVKAATSGEVGLSIKTNLQFFDAKTLRLVASLGVPNMVVSLGVLPDHSVFYVLVSTPHKYNYDDSPLALCLIDPFARQIDRIKLIENNHWLALENPARVSTDINRIIFSYDKTCRGSENNDYIISKPSNVYFKNIDVIIQPVPKGALGGDDLREASQKIFKQHTMSDLGATSYAGITSPDEVPHFGGGIFARYWESDYASVAVTDGVPSEMHIVRSTPSGELVDICASRLKADVVKVGNSWPRQPGVFSDGTLRCLSDQGLVFVKNKIVKHYPLPQSVCFFNNTTAFCFLTGTSQSGGGNVEDIRTYRNTTKEQVLALNSAGRIHRVQCEAIALNSDLLNKVGSCFLFPETDSFVVSSRSENDEFLYTHQRYSLGNGLRKGSGVTIAVGGQVGEHYVEYGKSLEGWSIISAVSAISTSGISYSIIAQNDKEKKPIIVAEGLPDLARLLELRGSKKGNLQILYSMPNYTRLVELTPEGRQFGLTEWNHSPLDGSPLLLSAKNLIFIPQAGGYKVYSVFGDTKPEKSFEIYFRGISDYVILLPDGYYAGSPGCEELITLRSREGSVDASALAPWRNRPAKVLKALGADAEQIEVLSKVTERWQKRIGFDPAKSEPKASDLPKVFVPERPQLWAEGEEAVFTIRWEKGASPIKNVMVRVNGVESARFECATLPTASGDKGTVNVTVKLADGQNWIEVTAEDIDGRRSDMQRFRTILKDSPTGTRRYIVALGVSDYTKPELNLQFAAKDAADIAAAIKEITKGETEVLFLTDEKVTKDAPAKIREFLANASENDEVVAFCAGHGVLDSDLDYVFASHEFDPANPSETGIKLDDLVGAVSSAKALKRLLLLDTCHAGIVGEKDEMLLAQMDSKLPSGIRAVAQRGMKVQPVTDFSTTEKQRFIEEMFSLPGTIRGVNIIGASAGAQFALESDKWSNGVFTASVIEGLSDKKADWNQDGRVNVGELRNYLAQRVSELTMGAQKPSVVAAERDQDFDLIRASYRRPTKSSASVPSSSLLSSELPPEESVDLESRIRSYYQAIQARNDAAVVNFYADQVDYYSSGTIPKSKVMADVRGDWKRYSNATFAVSNFETLSPNSCQFILDYSLIQGDRPRRGKLQISATLTSNHPQKIQSIKAKVISAK